MTVLAILLASLAFPICLFAERIGRFLVVMDVPDGRRKRHPRPTPMVGGVAILLPLAVVFFIDSRYGEGGLASVQLAAAMAVFLFIGYADDRLHLRPSVRLLLSLFVCLAIIGTMPAFAVKRFDFSFAGSSLGLGGWDLVFNVVVLVGFVYALNMADGINGLVIGLSLIWTGLLLFFAADQFTPALVALAVALGITFVFNFRGRVFLGDSGSYGLGILIGLLAIHSYNLGAHTLPADAVAVWFLIPVLDCVRLICWRVSRGQSPLAADRNHLHHLLQNRMSGPAALAVYLLLVGIPSVLAAALPEWTILWMGLGVAAYVSLVLRIFRWLRISRKIPARTKLPDGS